MNSFRLIGGHCLAFFLILQTASAVKSYVGETDVNQRRMSDEQAARRGPITKEEAIAISRSNWHGQRQPFKFPIPVACERARLWVVIYEDEGADYYIDKTSGAIVSLGFAPAIQSANGSHTSISKIEAIEIGRRAFSDFLTRMGDNTAQIANYDPLACEVGDAWRVFFDYRAEPWMTVATLPNTNPPHYVISKRSGKIVFTSH